jgi:hypothetical protein
MLALNVPSHLLKTGARPLLTQIIESEINDRVWVASMVRNGYLPERAVQTGLGDINIKCQRLVIEQVKVLNLIVVLCHRI